MPGKNTIVVGFLVAAIVSLPGTAIVLGDPAPPLRVAEWVKGAPVDLAEGKGENIYVVEFWGTFCIPCHKNVPLLCALQEKYRNEGVIVVGISSEKLCDVNAYLGEKGQAIGYRVAVDDRQMTWQAYMDGFGREMIPQAFIVDRAGRVVWEGHPAQGLEEALKQVVAGTYDVDAAREAFLARRQAPAWHAEYLRRIQARPGADRQELDALGEKIVRHCEDPARLDQLAWHIATSGDVKYRDLELAAKASAKALERTDGEDAVVLETHARVLFELGQVDKAVECQKRAIAQAAGNRQRRAYKKKLRKYEKAL